MNGPEGGSAPPGGAMGPSLWHRHPVPKRKIAVVHGPLVPRSASPCEELRPRELGPPGLAVAAPGPCADLGSTRDPAAPSGDVVLPGGQCRGTSPRDFRSSRDHRLSRDSRDIPLRIDVGSLPVSRDYSSSSPSGLLPTRDVTASSARLSRDMMRGDAARPKDATSPICNTIMSASSCSAAVVSPVTPPTVTGCSGDVNMPSTVYGSSPGRKLEDTLAGLRLAPPRESVLVRGPGLSAARPQVTSPQILEQHISKIISENAAIVETLDPLWTKRYMRHSNSGSNSSSSSSVSGSSADSRSASLGGGSSSARKWSLDPSAAGYRGRSNPRRVSESALVRTSLSPSVPATSAVTAPTSTVAAPPPDAPDGSIIRDLLLRHRGEGGAEGACPKCGIWFRSAATLEVHLEHYCKAPNPPPKKRKISEPVLSSHHAAAASRFPFPPMSTHAADDMMTGHVSCSVGASGSSRSNSVSFLPGPPAGADKMPGPPLPPPAALPPLPPLVASSPPALSPPVLTAAPPVVTVVPTTSLLAPPLRANRPTSLALGSGASTLVGSTLVSPETPRPKKTCLQLYINGHAYTYLGLKCSTRSTYCCIYRPQPMYVAQEAAPPGLSMYSDWRVVPVAEPVPGVSHVRLLRHYDSRQWLHSGASRTTMSPCGAAAPLVTHSSYWLYRSRAPPKEASQSTAMESDGSAAPPKSSVPEPVPSSEPPVVMETMDTVPVTSAATAEHVQVVQSVVPSVPVQAMPQAAPLLPPTLAPPPAVPPPASVPAATSPEGPGSPMEIEPVAAAPKEDVATTPADESRNTTSGSPKRVRIFEGGFKSNEAYTYVRGRGRGKYVCEECGIRCKKPSMLKKHIRTHTDLRPFSCHHCCFAFKTKGNLTKHMKSKAHHKKCTELGILPVPTTVDDSTQVDPDTLARQEQQQREQPASEDDEEEEEEEEEEEDDDDEEEEEEEEEEDDEGAPIGLLAVAPPPPMPQPIISSGLPPPSVSCSIPVITLTGPPDSVSPLTHPSAAAMAATTCQVSEEQEAARSLLHLSAHVPDVSWPSDGLPTMPSTSRASPITATVGPATSLMVGPATYVGAGSPGNHGTSTELTPPESGSWPQGGLPWLSSPPAGHRPRSFSMEMHERAAGIAEAEPTRRYSMSSLGRHPDEGPMDLSTARQRRLEILPGGYVSGHNVRSYAREGGLLGACLELGGTAPPLPQGQVPAAAGTSCESGGTSSGSGGGAGEEGRCGICHKSFARASQLRMHVNIHYFERPFRCEACAVSFRTRGHLQKHRRSVGHYNRLNMNLAFGAPSADNPRPFKCADCQIAFRIHGHLAKHLRSKMHILKLECLGKLPFGMYAEMERSGVNLNEIDTSDCDNSLESLQVMAQKLYQGGEPVASPLGAAMDEASPLRGEASPPHVVEGPPPTSWESGALRPCPLCGRLLKSAKSLQVHLHCDHPPGAGLQPDEEGGVPEVPPPPLATPWPCSICQKVFPSQALLQQHFVSHTQPRPYVCDQCDAGFTSALLLANHVANSHSAADNILPPRVPLVQSPVLSTV